MPNVMAALPNIGGALCSTPTTTVPCSNAAKTRNPLKLPGMPKLTKRSQLIVGRSSPGHVEEVLLLNKCFPIVDTYLSCEDRTRRSCAMVPR